MADSPKLFATTLTVQRFLLAVWVGAAVLYVITSVAEQTSEHFGLRERDLLATIRFPLYYKFGFLIHIVAATMSFLTWRAAPEGQTKRWLTVLLLTMLSGILMTLDYQIIYRPLQELISTPGQPRSEEFTKLHNWSKYANEVHVSVICIAALISAVPAKPARSADSESK